MELMRGDTSWEVSIAPVVLLQEKRRLYGLARQAKEKPLNLWISAK